MNKFWVLTRVLFKNGVMPGRRTDGDRRGKMAALIAAAALLPMFIMQGFAIWKLYDGLIAGHMTGAFLAGLLTAACVTMILFGILYVISTYYFSDDTILLLTMPIPSYRILAAKFMVVLVFQYWLEAMIALPGIAVLGVRGGGAFYWINAVLVFAALPLIPTAICSVISILVMAFSRFFRNKDRVKFFAGLVGIIVAFGISIVMQEFGARSSSSAQTLQSSSGLMQNAAVLFPSNILAARAILDGTAVSLLWLVLFLLVSAAGIAAFLALGDRLYLRGVVGLSQNSVKAQKKQGNFRLKKHSVPAAVALKDWRLLCRTPAFALNCLLSAFLVPLIVVVCLGFSLHGAALPKENIMVIAFGILILSFVAMVNNASATALSRDGRDAVLSCFFPVSTEKQILGKLIPGLLLSFAELVVMAVPLQIMLRLDPVTAAATYGLSAVAVVSSNLFGLLIDLAFPKLEWDDETVAVKQNVNLVIAMAVLLVTLGLPAFVVYQTKMNLWSGILFLAVYNLALLAAAALLLFRKGPDFYRAALTGKAAKKAVDRQKTIRVAGSIVVAAVVLGVIGWEFFFVHTNVKITGPQVSVTAGIGESSSFRLDQIKTVTMKDTLPHVSSKVVGYASGNQMRGAFQVDGMGRGHLYTQNAKGPFLYIILKDGSFTVFNFDDVKQTDSLYASLKPYAK